MKHFSFITRYSNDHVVVVVVVVVLSFLIISFFIAVYWKRNHATDEEFEETLKKNYTNEIQGSRVCVV